MTGGMEPPTWRGDPALIVFAARHALTKPGSAAATVVLQSLQANRGSLPANAQQVLARDITAWLEGPGAEETAAHREPWVLALAALGIRRKPVRAEASR